MSVILKLTLSLLLTCSNLPVADNLLWVTAAADTLQVCEGEDAVLDWGFSLSMVPWEELYSVQWSLVPDEASNTTLYMAQFIHGRFWRNQDFARSVAMVNNAGVMLRNVSKVDQGLYFVVVTVIKNHTLDAYNQSVRLMVAEPSRLEGDTLQLSLSPVAILSPDLGTWNNQLRCGRFERLGQPPVSITWTMPNGTEVDSSGNNKTGDFLFDITSQNETGSYACRVTSHQNACAHSRARATYRVEAASLRLNLIEARMSRLAEVLAPALRVAKLRAEAELEFEKHIQLNSTLKSLWKETGRIMVETIRLSHNRTH